MDAKTFNSLLRVLDTMVLGQLTKPDKDVERVSRWAVKQILTNQKLV